ncbi:MAG: hypothetical protein U0793_18215 [Gemmataceae bacterium]
MLDELDELMEKMLALPVSDTDDAPGLEAAKARLPKVSATLTVLEGPEAGPAAFEASSIETPSETTAVDTPRLDLPVSIQPPHAEFQLTAPTPTLTTFRGADDLPLDAIPPSLLEVKVPEVRLLPMAGRTLGTILLQPLIAFNILFDLATRFLGPFGRWLRTAAGRNALGAAGLGLILLGIGWLVRDWLSWTR